MSDIQGFVRPDTQRMSRSELERIVAAGQALNVQLSTPVPALQLSFWGGSFKLVLTFELNKLIKWP